ncbi:DUF983 domain-containing protein [Hymenobacter ruricola]|uniref:DUF983 domain-containing protein n=1 Tax=Hymenobacter ruricola TaxID=2791023 RepID=A0ABS0HZL7_9BACT|nr:DUF983 domain-containing protein [Hymenobacter ruricola]MBF9220152.1 DUF983 domain-containing protein [Hymenobacter ruricola]
MHPSSAPVMADPTDTSEFVDSTALALLQLRCPRCHQGKLFSTSALNVTRFAQMPEQCPVCGQSFEPEPGFYFGSMFITFAFNVATFLGLGVLIYYLLDNPDTWVYVSIITGVTVLFTPLILRYSRALMLYLFGGVQYRKGVKS